MSVLILAEDIDATADQVVLAPAERGIDVHRVNTAWFPAQLRLSVRLLGNHWSGTLRTSARLIDLESVTAVWYRTPRAYQFPAELSPAELAHANLEAKYGLGGVLASLPVLWVNHPARLADAAYKPMQLVTARRCGLTVPDTLITQDPDAVRGFAGEGATVTKILGANTILEEGVRKVAFTRVVGEADLADLRGVDVTTHLFQRWVPKAYEARVIVIGEQITAAAIHASNGGRGPRSSWSTRTVPTGSPRPARPRCGPRSRTPASGGPPWANRTGRGWASRSPRTGSGRGWTTRPGRTPGRSAAELDGRNPARSTVHAVA